MNIKQAKRNFGTAGTKRTRKQWQRAKNQGKTPNSKSHTNFPNVITGKEEISKEDIILEKINTKISKMV